MPVHRMNTQVADAHVSTLHASTQNLESLSFNKYMQRIQKSHNNNNNNNNNQIKRRKSIFFTVSSLRHELSPTRTFMWPGRNRVQITCNTQSGLHVQRVVCHLVRRDSSAVKVGSIEIAFISALVYWLKRLTDKGGEETGVLGENP